MRQWKRALCIFLSVVMFVTVGGRFVQTAFASELTNDSIKKKEEEIVEEAAPAGPTQEELLAEIRDLLNEKN